MLFLLTWKQSCVGGRRPACPQVSSSVAVGPEGHRMHPGCPVRLCETSRHLIAALLEVWFGLVSLGSPTLGCPGEGSVVPGFPPQICLDSHILRLLRKARGRLAAGRCRAGTALAAGTQIRLVAPISVYLGVFSIRTLFLLAYLFCLDLINKRPISSACWGCFRCSTFWRLAVWKWCFGPV